MPDKMPSIAFDFYDAIEHELRIQQRLDDYSIGARPVENRLIYEDDAHDGFEPEDVNPTERVRQDNMDTGSSAVSSEAKWCSDNEIFGGKIIPYSSASVHRSIESWGQDEARAASTLVEMGAHKAFASTNSIDRPRLRLRIQS